MTPHKHKQIWFILLFCMNCFITCSMYAGIPIVLSIIQGCGNPRATFILQASPQANHDVHHKIPLEVLPGTSPIIPSLGTGWSTVAESYVGRCVTTATRRLQRADASGILRLNNTMDAEKAQHSLGFQAGTKAHFGIDAASLQAQAASAMSKDAFSTVWIFTTSYTGDVEEFDFLEDLQLTAIGRAAEKNGTWRRDCGDEFIYQIHQGAQLFLIYRLDFKSEDVKQQIEAELMGSRNILEVNNSLRKINDLLASHAQLTIEVHQFGGDPRLITGIITGPSANLEKAEESTRAVIHCDADHLDTCEYFLTQALLYATSLDEPHAFPQQIHRGGGSPTLYVTMPWSRLGKPVAHLPSNDAIEHARLKLTVLFDKIMMSSRRIDTLLHANWVESMQRAELEPWRTTLNYNLMQIKTAVKLCYDDLELLEMPQQTQYTHISADRCTNMVHKLESTINLPDYNLLRGPIERAIYQASQQTNHLLNIKHVGDVQCSTTLGNVICGYDNHGTIHTYIIDETIYQAWRDLPGSMQSNLATYPISNTQHLTQTNTNIRYVEFAPHSVMYWLQNTHKKPSLISGNLLDYWQNNHGDSRLGFPIENQVTLPNSMETYAHFSLGTSVYCRPAFGCIEMPQIILNAWMDQGGPKSCLRYPVQKRKQDSLKITYCFEGGSIKQSITDTLAVVTSQCFGYFNMWRACP